MTKWVVLAGVVTGVVLVAGFITYLAEDEKKGQNLHFPPDELFAYRATTSKLRP